MYRTVPQLDSVMNILSLFFPALCTRVEMPHRSVENRPIFALRIRAGSSTGNRRSILIAGGMHARELMNPDAIADLQLDLVTAYLNETGITLGGKSWSQLDIKTMLESLEVWFLPCANPDGREFVMNVDDLWRKNRRDNPGTGICEGVDINRNCDIVWGVTTSTTSCNPCTHTYLGPDRFSEPESLNIKDFCEAHQIDVFLDVHSFTELVLFPWGHAHTQTEDPDQNFLDLATGTCLPINPPGHLEYMLPRDQLRYRRVAQKVVDDIRAVRGRNYTPQSIRDLYATTGTTTDYVYSRHLANSALHKTYGFAFETGPTIFNDDGTINERESFHPLDSTLIRRDTKAGIISLMLQSICAIEVIGGGILGSATRLETIRNVRDEQMLTTKAGRDLIALFERVQMPLLSLVLADQSLTKEALGLLEISVKLLQKDETVLTAREVDRGIAFIDALKSRTKAKTLRSDLETVRKHLKGSANKSVNDALKKVIGTPAGTTKKESTSKKSKTSRPKS